MAFLCLGFCICGMETGAIYLAEGTPRTMDRNCVAASLGCGSPREMLWGHWKDLSLKLELTILLDRLVRNHEEPAHIHICWDANHCLELFIYLFVCLFTYMSVGNTAQVLRLVHQAHF